MPQNAHSVVCDIKWGDSVYSIDLDLIEEGDAYELRGKEIGYAKEDGGTRWKIFARKGYAPEDYIVAYPDVIMSTYSVYKRGKGTVPQYTNISAFPDLGITMEFPL